MKNFEKNDYMSAYGALAVRTGRTPVNTALPVVNVIVHKIMIDNISNGGMDIGGPCDAARSSTCTEYIPAVGSYGML